LKTVYRQYYKSPFGILVLGSVDGKLCICDWKNRKNREKIDKRVLTFFKAEFKQRKTPVLELAQKQLDEYFEAKRIDFELPIVLAGSKFQIEIWTLLREIPFGKTTTYKKLSMKYGKPAAIRAVANANGANALSIIIPCHRVVGSNGSLVGYAGGLSAKKKLLFLEGSQSQLTLF
jgi:methylated-DNA-[protein]-cysteine S-methyltransferase